jgi:hypothetical protein
MLKFTRRYVKIELASTLAISIYNKQCKNFADENIIELFNVWHQISSFCWSELCRYVAFL